MNKTHEAITRAAEFHDIRAALYTLIVHLGAAVVPVTQQIAQCDFAACWGELQRETRAEHLIEYAPELEKAMHPLIPVAPDLACPVGQLLRSGLSILSTASPLPVAQVLRHRAPVAHGDTNARLIVREEKLIALFVASPSLLSSLRDLVSLARDPAGSQYTLREIFGTFNQTAQIEGSNALRAIKKAEGQTV